jgi:pimeloyl-ACP methyl ester carboxylesterase
MKPIRAHVKQAGEGPAVLCLHANASHSGQWRGLMGVLSSRYRVVAPDCYGAGQTGDWPCDRTISLQDEVDLLMPLLQSLGRFSIVGHSYGAALSLKIALLFPDRVQSLALFEPTFFSIVEQEGPTPNEVDGIRHAVGNAGKALDQGDSFLAAQHFIDFWMGPGAWAATPADRQPAIADAVRNVRRWGYALFTEPATRIAFLNLDMPVLYMTGGKSQRSAHAVADRLLTLLPRANAMNFPDMGHMGPITHAAQVNAAVAGFLDQVILHKPLQ